MWRNATAQAASPKIMKGIEAKRIRRRPMRSITAKATRVRMKFVRAIESEVPMGEVKPTREKMVAEKYMREFCVMLVVLPTKNSTYIDLQSHIAVVDLEACMQWSEHACF